MAVTSLGFKSTICVPVELMRTMWKDAHLKTIYRHKLRLIEPRPISYGSDSFDTTEWAVFSTEADAIAWEESARQLISRLSGESVDGLAKADKEISVSIEGDQSFTPRRLAQQLEMIAMGEAFFGQALRAAKKLPIVDEDEKALLSRFENGTDSGIDHVSLQVVALRIRRAADVAD